MGSTESLVVPDVLIVIDVQNDFCHADGALAHRGADISGMPQVAANNERLAAAYRAAAKPVIYMRTEHGPWTNSVNWSSRMRHLSPEAKEATPICAAGTWGEDFYDVHPQPEDRVITKHRYSAFFMTPLEVVLRAHQATSLLLTGVVTNVCVETTARDAFMRDYRTLVVREACAAPSPEEHRAALHNIDTYFGQVVGIEDVLEAMPDRQAKVS